MKVSDDIAFELLKSFQDQLECYQALTQLSEKQSEYILSGNEEELLKLIEKKGDLIQQVDSYTQQYKEEKAELEITPMGEFSSIDSELDHILQAIEKELQILIESESNDMQVLENFQKKNNEKMAQLGKGKNIAKAYLKNKNPSSMNRSV